ncbi:DUF4254 domain-containing protein [Nocardia sp. AG03]|uniref:DUF4254 domain-containing protein n=1 Tax=Nocardia sp. AG03 TaxID=3025312 RepID=UPI0024181B07|nr:DUF4254 domain-containing protein [Nocardia sp. AG03]
MKVSHPVRQRTAGPTMLPCRSALLAALRGLPHDEHPILDAAGELAVLHQARERTPLSEVAAIDRRRAQLMRAVDRWVILAAPVPRAGAEEHCETLGSLVDRLARHSSQTHIELASAPDAVYYDEWVRLEDLADTYQRLVDDLWAGVRSLPY